MKKSINLKTRFTISFSIIILVLTFILSSVISLNSISIYKKEIGNSLSERVWQMSNRLDQYMWARYGEINVLSKLDIFKNTSNTKEVRKVLDELKLNFPSYSWVGLIDPNGEVLESTDGILKGKNISARPVYNQALNSTYIGDVHDAVLLSSLLPNPTGEAMKFVDISTPIFSDNGELTGILASHLSWGWAKEVEGTMVQSNNNKEKMEVFIVSKGDNAVLLGPTELIGTNLNLGSIDKARAGENGWSVETWPDGKKYLTGYILEGGYENYPGLGWVILARQPVELAYEAIQNQIIFSVTFGILAVITFVIFGVISANIITKPLKQLTFVANKLREGEDVEVPKLKGIREIEVLSSSLDSLIKSLIKTKGELGEMEELANYDKLTRLPNRIALGNYLEKLVLTKDENLTFTILYMDLDGFKSVNDTYGHHVGDILLQEVADRIKEDIGSGELAARLGGDEFVVVAINSNEDVKARGSLVANKIIEDLSRPFVIEQKEIRVGCSVGGAVWNIDSTDTIELTRMADQALYKSKRSGKGKFTYYNKEN